MKKLFFFLPVFIFILGFTTNKIIDDKLKNLLQQFNINEETAKSNKQKIKTTFFILEAHTTFYRVNFIISCFKSDIILPSSIHTEINYKTINAIFKFSFTFMLHI